MEEKIDFVDDICTHKDCDCGCMTAKEKRWQQKYDALTQRLKEARRFLELSYKDFEGACRICGVLEHTKDCRIAKWLEETK